MHKLYILQYANARPHASSTAFICVSVCVRADVAGGSASGLCLRVINVPGRVGPKSYMTNRERERERIRKMGRKREEKGSRGAGAAFLLAGPAMFPIM